MLDYNNKLQQFPTVFFANVLKFERREYFEADEAAREVPEGRVLIAACDRRYGVRRVS